jgi:hypothetical protein
MCVGGAKGLLVFVRYVHVCVGYTRRNNKLFRITSWNGINILAVEFIQT